MTDANAADQGSITLDPALMEAAELLELEGMQVVNRPNGARFETYINAGESGSGENRIVEGGDGEGRRRQVEVS